jgi:DNA repair protein RadC
MDYNITRTTKQLELFERNLENKQKPAKRVDIVSLRLVIEKSIIYRERCVRSPEDGYHLIRQFIGDMDREVLLLVCLDTKNQPTAINICHIGSLSSSIVHPREVMKTAILSNAASMIIAHNHPSGNASPSHEDIEVTKRMKEAGKIIGIDLLDHIIVGDEVFLSLKEKGYI